MERLSYVWRVLSRFSLEMVLLALAIVDLLVYIGIGLSKTMTKCRTFVVVVVIINILNDRCASVIYSIPLYGLDWLKSFKIKN